MQNCVDNQRRTCHVYMKKEKNSATEHENKRIAASAKKKWPHLTDRTNETAVYEGDIERRTWRWSDESLRAPACGPCSGGNSMDARMMMCHRRVETYYAMRWVVCNASGKLRPSCASRDGTHRAGDKVQSVFRREVTDWFEFSLAS